jgi:hypothetical protein
MYALLAICTTLSPGPTDESIMSIVKEHYADQLQTLQRGGPESLEIYKDLFLSSCPKYLSVNPPPYEDATLLEQYISNPPTDATVRHLELFLSDVEAVRGVSGVRNLLKLYTSIDASKLAAFNSVEGQGEKEILEQLMVLKGASRTYSHQTGEGSSTLLDGDRLVTNNLDFTIDAVSPLVEISSLLLHFPSFHLNYCSAFGLCVISANVRQWCTLKKQPLTDDTQDTLSVTPNMPRGSSTLSDHLPSHPSENRLLLLLRDRKRRRLEVKRRMFGNLKRGFRLLLRVLVVHSLIRCICIHVFRVAG